jgi:hypothetical protein
MAGELERDRRKADHKSERGTSRDRRAGETHPKEVLDCKKDDDAGVHSEENPCESLIGVESGQGREDGEDRAAPGDSAVSTGVPGSELGRGGRQLTRRRSGTSHPSVPSEPPLSS